VATVDKQIYFYDMQISANGFKFEEEKKTLTVANKPIHLCKIVFKIYPYIVWDDNTLYLTTKKAYVIMDK
jgi:hypothetical protein